MYNIVRTLSKQARKIATETLEPAIILFQRGLPKVPCSMSHFVSQSISQLVSQFVSQSVSVFQFFKTHVTRPSPAQACCNMFYFLSVKRPQSGICPAPVCFLNVQAPCPNSSIQVKWSLHETVVFSVCACMDNAAHIISIIFWDRAGRLNLNLLPFFLTEHLVRWKNET